LKPSLFETFLISSPGWWGGWWHKSTQIHKKTLSFPRRGTQGEREEKFQTDDRLLMLQCILLCRIFIFPSEHFFLLRIWKHGLAIERFMKGFCFIMHWNDFLMAKENQAILWLKKKKGTCITIQRRVVRFCNFLWKNVITYSEWIQ
jgi:hypothetical protein